MKEMMRVILHYYNLESLTQKGQGGRLREAKNMARYILRTELEMELKVIAKVTGVKSHASVWKSVKLVQDLIDTDKKVLDDYLNIVSMADGCIDLDYRWRKLNLKPSKKYRRFFLRKDGVELFFKNYRDAEDFLGISGKNKVNTLSHRMTSIKGWRVYNELNRPERGRKPKITCKAWMN